MFIFEQNMTDRFLFSLSFLGSGSSPVTLDMLSVTCLLSCAQEAQQDYKSEASLATE